MSLQRGRSKMPKIQSKTRRTDDEFLLTSFWKNTRNVSVAFCTLHDACSACAAHYVCRPPFFFAFIFWYISVSVFFANILCSFCLLFASPSLCRAAICLYAFYIIQFVFGFLLLCADGVSGAFKCSECCSWLQYDHL